MTDYFSAGEGEREQSIASRNGQMLLTGRGRAAEDEGQSREQGWGFGYSLAPHVRSRAMDGARKERWDGGGLWNEARRSLLRIGRHYSWRVVFVLIWAWAY